MSFCVGDILVRIPEDSIHLVYVILCRQSSGMHTRRFNTSAICCIRCGPDEERILYVVPREDGARNSG